MMKHKRSQMTFEMVRKELANKFMWWFWLESWTLESIVRGFLCINTLSHLCPRKPRHPTNYWFSSYISSSNHTWTWTPSFSFCTNVTKRNIHYNDSPLVNENKSVISHFPSSSCRLWLSAHTKMINSTRRLINCIRIPSPLRNRKNLQEIVCFDCALLCCSWSQCLASVKRTPDFLNTRLSGHLRGRNV